MPRSINLADGGCCPPATAATTCPRTAQVGDPEDLLWDTGGSYPQLGISKNNNLTHRIHGAAIYGNMDPINIPPLC